MLLLPLFLLAACGGSSEEATPARSPPAQAPTVDQTPPAAESSTRQIIYNQWLEFHRTETITDPEVVDYACDPLYWDALTEQVPEERYPVLFRIALIDACHEAGELSEFDVWSPYYADAPKP